MPIGYTTNTCVSCIHVSMYKVGCMMANTLVYAGTTLNYNKVMRIIPALYRVATIINQ